MLYLISNLLLEAVLQPDLEAFKQFKKSGTEAVCMVNYDTKTIECKYKDMEACRNDYANHKISVCFPRKNLKLGDN